jgi:hypothetical protein
MDPNGLSGIEEGLRDLIQYPYGCLEQTTSRLIPLVMVSELAKSLQLGIDGPELQSFIRAGVTKIQRHQNEDGGFSLWPGGQSTSYLSAYALWGLKVAKDAGYEVSDQRVRDGVAYLRTELAIEARAERVHVYQGELASRAFALYVMSLWGQAQPSSATQLFEKRAQLPRYGMAYLARALAASLGPDDASVATVLDELAKAAEVTGDSAVVLEPDASLRWYMSDDVRTTAMVLDAYVSLRPSDPLLPQLVRGLMHQRRNDARYGAWETTQDDLYALVGLTHYARSRQPSDVAVNASVGGKQILKGRLPKEAGLRIVRATVPLPDASAGGAPLVIEAKGGTSFYSARVRFQRDMDHQKATSSGFTLTREVLDPRLEKPVAAIHTGDTVLVRLTVSTPEERTHVAITDYLPAGFEPVQTKFVTSGATEKPAEDEQDWRYEYCGHTSHRELRDDRVDIFADYYCKGTFKFEYLAKATTAGSFVMPGAMVEEMYAPEVYAVLSSEKIEIRAK